MRKFSLNSKRRLSTVHPVLQRLCEEALPLSEYDFGITEGLRTGTKQRLLYEQGKTKTLSSMHLIGQAVDLVAYEDGQVSWRLGCYDQIARAFQWVLHKNEWEEDFRIRWGGAWHIPSLGAVRLEIHPTDLRQEYMNLRIEEGRPVFIDAVHFELHLLSESGLT